MRLGGPIMKDFNSPEGWIELVKELGYRAVYFPCDSKADKATVSAYKKATQDNGLTIAEVGAWSNPLSKDENEAKKALLYCQEQLALADEVGACCCVNIAGSQGENWDGPEINSFSQDTFDLIVDSVREIIDAVKPSRTYYALEMMPWMFPDSPDTYLKIIKAVDRKAFAVHLDPVNIICSPRAYYFNGDLLRECFDKLGGYIKSCHAKDILLEQNLTTHLNEKRIGEGMLDYATYLQCLDKLDKDTPIMLEHLSTHEDVIFSLNNIRAVAKTIGITI